MSVHAAPPDEDSATVEARDAFERVIGVTGIDVVKAQAGDRTFLKFVVGREAPLYLYGLRTAQHALSTDNPFAGALGLELRKSETFPRSKEANALLTLLTRSTREVSQDTADHGFSVPYIPFQNREDHQLAQPASHIVQGRRGVGKSTLIRRAISLLSTTPALVAVLDMQAYSTLVGDDLTREVVHDLCDSLVHGAVSSSERLGMNLEVTPLTELASRILADQIPVPRIAPALKRAIGALTRKTKSHAFIFLDDYHLIDPDAQPGLLHILHGGLKGANGWLKVAGLTSLLNFYSPGGRQGLQVPGDAQPISLDLTLENPEAAQSHLQAILSSFLKAVGYSYSSAVIPEAAFKRLVWANAGVPRDFLQMFARALEHAQRNKHSSVTLSDVNVAIGEFGQRKLDDLDRDARNAAGELRAALTALESYCLDENKVNGFLIRSEESDERRLVHVLSDLRMVHLIHQSITPEKAGERYEAFILDYSLFTGFRRRPNVREMLPTEAQFKAAELRQLPKVAQGFLSRRSQPV